MDLWTSHHRIISGNVLVLTGHYLFYNRDRVNCFKFVCMCVLSVCVCVWCIPVCLCVLNWSVLLTCCISCSVLPAVMMMLTRHAPPPSARVAYHFSPVLPAWPGSVRLTTSLIIPCFTNGGLLLWAAGSVWTIGTSGYPFP